MAKYKVISEFFYLDQMQKVGTEIEFDGEPGENLEPVDDEAKAKAADAAARREVKRLALNTPGGAGGMTPEMQDFISKLADTVKQQSADIADLKKNTTAGVDVSNFVTKTEVASLNTKVDQMGADISEHDQGLSLLHDRLTEVEGVIDSRPPATPAEPASTDPAPSPTPAADAPQPVSPPDEPPAT